MVAIVAESGVLRSERSGAFCPEMEGTSDMGLCSHPKVNNDTRLRGQAQTNVWIIRVLLRIGFLPGDGFDGGMMRTFAIE